MITKLYLIFKKNMQTIFQILKKTKIRKLHVKSSKQIKNVNFVKSQNLYTNKQVNKKLLKNTMKFSFLFI